MATSYSPHLDATSSPDYNDYLSICSRSLSVDGGGGRPGWYKAVGIGLAVGSGAFIGTSFVLKKVGLLKANAKYNEVAGEGYGYLRNFYWWSGMILMIVGEICNFVAYAFTDAILVTPLGALSVVITTVLSAIFLKERLSVVGKVACFLCIVGSVVIVLNAPETSSVANAEEMQDFVITPGFLSYTGVIIVGSVITAFYVGPRWGNKNMLVYLSICSWIGGLSVVCTQGLGAAIIAWISGKPEYKSWFFWVLFVFVICTLLVEIIYLNVSCSILPAAYSNADSLTESLEPFQRSHGHSHLLRVLYEHHHYYICCLIPGLQGLASRNHHRGHGLLGHLLRCRPTTALEIGQRCPRYRRLPRRPRPDANHCRTGTT